MKHRAKSPRDERGLSRFRGLLLPSLLVLIGLFALAFSLPVSGDTGEKEKDKDKELKKPGEDKKKPADGDKKPGEDKKKPVDGKKTPGKDTKKPGEKGKGKDEDKGKEKGKGKDDKKKGAEKKKKRLLSFKLLTPPVKKAEKKGDPTPLSIPSRGKVKVSGVIGRGKKSMVVKAVYVNGIKATLKRMKYTFSEGEEIRFEAQIEVKKIKKHIILGINSAKDEWKKWDVVRPVVVKRKTYLLRVFGHFPVRQDGAVNRTLFSPKGDLLHITGEGRVLEEWDLATQVRNWKYDLPSAGTSLVRLGEDLLAVGLETGQLHIVDKEGKKVQILAVAKERLNRLWWRSREKQVIAAGAGGNIHLLVMKKDKLAKGKLLEGHKGEVIDFALHEKTGKLFSVGQDRTIRRWDLKTGKLEQWQVSRDSGEFTALAFSSGGALVTGDTRGRVRLWNRTKLRSLQEIRHHYASITALLVKGRQIFAADIRSRLSVGTVKKSVFYSTPAQVNTMSLSPKGKRLFLGFGQGQGRLVHLEESFPNQLTSRPPMWKKLALGNQGKTLVAGDTKGGVTYWKKGKKSWSQHRIQRHGDGIMGLVLDGRRLAAASWDGRLLVTETREKKAPQKYFRACPYPIMGMVQLSNQRVLVLDIEGRAYFYPLSAKGKDEKYKMGKAVFQDVVKDITTFTWHRDGHLVFAHDKKIYHYNTKGKLLHSYDSLESTITALSFFGKKLVVATKKGKVSLWDLAKKKKTEELEFDERGPIRQVKSLKDENLLILTDSHLSVVSPKTKKSLMEFKLPEPSVAMASYQGMVAVSTFGHRIYFYELKKVVQRKKPTKTKKKPVKKIIAPPPTEKKTAAKDPISGTWDGLAMMAGSNRQEKFTMYLTLKGTEVTGRGVFHNSSGGKDRTIPIGRGTFQENKLFVEFTFQGASMSMDFELVSPGKLRGQWSVAQADMSGQVEATRRSP